MTGIVKIWGPDYRLYGFIIHSQNSSDSVTEPAHILTNQRSPAVHGAGLFRGALEETFSYPPALLVVSDLP
jgi:hypothetical protein